MAPTQVWGGGEVRAGHLIREETLTKSLTPQLVCLWVGPSPRSLSWVGSQLPAFRSPLQVLKLSQLSTRGLSFLTWAPEKVLVILTL